MNVGGNTYSIAMGYVGAKAIVSSSGISFEVQSRGESWTFCSYYKGLGTHM